MNIKENMLVIVFLGFVITPLVSCNQSGDDKRSSPSELPKIVVISDSIGTGYGVATPFPERIAESVEVEVINDSENGRRTRGGVVVVREQLALHKPSHMLVLLGINDAIVGAVETAVENLQEIVDVANSTGVVAIVGTLPPDMRSAQSNDFAAQISNGIRSLNGAEIAEIRNSIGDGSTTIADGVHPNDNGQKIIAKEFLKHL